MTLVGLCGACRHHRTTGNRRGSIFHLCGRSATEPRFPKYPPLPVLRCPGFEPVDAGASSSEPPSEPPEEPPEEPPGEPSGEPSGPTHPGADPSRGR